MRTSRGMNLGVKSNAEFVDDSRQDGSDDHARIFDTDFPKTNDESIQHETPSQSLNDVNQ